MSKPKGNMNRLQGHGNPPVIAFHLELPSQCILPSQFDTLNAVQFLPSWFLLLVCFCINSLSVVIGDPINKMSSILAKRLTSNPPPILKNQNPDVTFGDNQIFEFALSISSWVKQLRGISFGPYHILNENGMNSSSWLLCINKAKNKCSFKDVNGFRGRNEPSVGHVDQSTWIYRYCRNTFRPHCPAAHTRGRILMCGNSF